MFQFDDESEALVRPAQVRNLTHQAATSEGSQKRVKHQASVSLPHEDRFHLDLDDSSPRGRLLALGAVISSANSTALPTSPLAQSPTTSSHQPAIPTDLFQPQRHESLQKRHDNVAVRQEGHSLRPATASWRQEILLLSRQESILGVPYNWLNRMTGRYRRWLLLVASRCYDPAAYCDCSPSLPRMSVSHYLRLHAVLSVVDAMNAA